MSHSFDDLLPGQSAHGAAAHSARRTPERAVTPLSDVATPAPGMSGRSVLLIAVFVIIVVVIVVMFVRRVRARREEVAEPAVEPDLPPVTGGEHPLGGSAGGQASLEEQRRQEAHTQAQARAHMQRLQQHHQQQQQAKMEQARQQQMVQQPPAQDNMFQPLPPHPVQTESEQ